MRRMPGLFLIFTVFFISLYTVSCCAESITNNARRDRLRQRPMPGGTSAPQASGPWFGLGLKNPSKDAGIDGALVGDVAVNSPADAAGIRIGDVIVDLNGQAVKSASDFININSTLEAGKTYKITLRRGSESLALDVTPQEKAVAIPVKRCLSDINVLTYAVIDPDSRVITLIGKYDPSYKTGPIPYYDLLNDAIKSPYPWFSLEPTKETKSGVERIHSSIGADVQRMYSDSSYCNTWAMNLLNMLLTDPSLQRDRAQFIKKGAEAFQITEDEMLKVLQKSSKTSNVSEEEMMPILGKTLRGMGYEQVGSALLAQPEGTQRVLELLGIRDEVAAVAAKYHSGEMTEARASLEITVLMESAILRGLRVPESDVTSRANMVLNGRMSAEAFQQYMEERLMAIIVDGVGLKMFNGLTLSHELLCKMYSVPTPQMGLVFRDIPADSLLGDILFRADYVLKSICTSPDVKNSIPGFPTEMNYMYESSVKKGIRIPGDAGAEVGHRLIPGEVKMRVSPSGTLVLFDEANVKIIGWIIKTVGKRCTSEVASVMKSSVEGYSDYLTQHYDELAKVFPELHRIREAEKLIALARWAKTNGYSIVVDRAAGIRMAQSPTAVGFWQAVFTADQQEFSLTVIAEGGASFDQDEGEAWIKPNVDSEVTSDVSKQLVMSAALAQQAATAAIDGDLESARDLADKSARAMTGDIDLTQLPSLGDLPMPGEPSKTVVLSNEALSAIDENLRKIENANISMEKAAELEKTSPEEAAKLREMAEAGKRQANANLQSLRDALESARKDPGKTNDAVVTIRGLGKVTPPSSNVAVTPHPSGTTQTTVSGQAPAAKPADDITPEQRAKWLAQLATLEKELEATKVQFLKLNKSIQQDQKQLDDWGKVAQDGMERCTGVLYNLLMDASAGALSDRYETMHELAKKLPNHPQDLISKLEQTKNWFKGLKYTQTFKDVSDMAARDGKTLPELLEEVRDSLNIIVGLTPLEKTTAGALWKYGSNIVDMSYSYAQFSAAYERIDQMDKNSDSYLKAVAALSARMQSIVAQIKELKSNLNTQPGR